MKSIYWFAYYNIKSPSVRYRGQYPLQFLESRYGIKSHFITPGYKPFEIYRFLKAFFSALFFSGHHSLIVIQRINSNFIYANLLKLLLRFKHQYTVYDLDDADYLDFSPVTIHHFIKNCSAVLVGSHELKRNLSVLNSRIYLNTSPVPDLGIARKARNEVLTIGWIGDFGGGHKISLLKYFFPALSELPFPIKLVLLGVGVKQHQFLTQYFSHLKNVTVEMPPDINWKDEAAVQNRIAAFDIGIATLLNTESQRSKSAFKLKQYMNNGVPVLSADVAENNFFLQHGVNGFLCSTAEDFRNRIIEFNFMDNYTYNTFSKRAAESAGYFNHELYCTTLLKVFENCKETVHHNTARKAQQVL